MRKLLTGIQAFWTRSIRRQLMLGIALVHAVLMSIFIVDLVARQEKFLAEQSVRQTQGLARSLAVNSGSWVLADDVIGLEEVISSQASYPGLIYAMVLDTHGKVLAHSDPGLLGMYASDAISLSLLGAPAYSKTLLADTRLVDIAAPVVVDERHIGWARVGVSKADIAKNLDVVTRDGLLYAVLAILVGTVFAWFMARGLTRGVHHLVDVSQRVREGDVEHRARIQREDELGQLSDDLNHMLDTLMSQQRELERSWDELARNEQRLDLAMRGANDGLWDWDLLSDRMYFSPRWKDLLGYADHEVGDSVSEWEKRVHPDDLEAARTDIARHISGERAYYENTQRLLHRDGSYRWHRVRGQAVFDDTGRAVRLVGTNSDISDQKEAEQVLHRSREELEKLVQARTGQLSNAIQELESFSYSVSHDLRAPLRAISGFSKILASRYSKLLDEKARDLLMRIVKAAGRMSELIDDTLALSRVTRSEVHFESVDLSAMAHDIERSLTEADPLRQVNWRIQANVRGVCDARLLKIALENLLSNAWKFTSRMAVANISFGEHGPEFRSEHAREGEQVFFVSDDGAGFKMEYATKLFGPFQRMHTEDEFEGTGIGLATVKRIIGKHGGQIWAESEIDKGTTFHFTLGLHTSGKHALEIHNEQT